MKLLSAITECLKAVSIVTGSFRRTIYKKEIHYCQTAGNHNMELYMILVKENQTSKIICKTSFDTHLKHVLRFHSNI